MKEFEEELKNGPVMIDKDNVTGTPIYDEVTLISYFNGWVSPEDHQAEIGKIELQNLKYRAEILGMQKALRKKNKVIKELNGAVKKSKARLKDWHSDEEFQLLLRDRDTLKQGNDNLFKNHLELVEENDELKAKLEKQQPEIPEVPQFVAELIKKRKGNWSLFGAFRNISGNKYDNEKLYEWVFAHAGRQEIFAQAWTNGYTVKEKRFYLKHIEMSKRDVHHDYYAQIRNERFEHDSVESGMLPQPVITGVTFTQQEIDSMETGSYEQIEVVK